MTSLFLNIFLQFKDMLVIFFPYWFIIIFPNLTANLKLLIDDFKMRLSFLSYQSLNYERIANKTLRSEWYIIVKDELLRKKNILASNNYTKKYVLRIINYDWAIIVLVLLLACHNYFYQFSGYFFGKKESFDSRTISNHCFLALLACCLYCWRKIYFIYLKIKSTTT
jgi:hypothetical protein